MQWNIPMQLDIFAFFGHMLYTHEVIVSPQIV